MTENDLPLFSNINDIRARHYLIDLKPSFPEKVFQGKVIIFFEVTTPCEKRGKCCTRKCFCQGEEEESFDTTSSKRNSQEGNCSHSKVETQKTFACENGESDAVTRSQSTELDSCCQAKTRMSFACENGESDTVLSSDSHPWVETQISSTCETGESDTLSNSANTELDFELVLDCCDIEVKQVTEVLCTKQEISEYLDPNFIRRCEHGMTLWSSKESHPLQFSVSKWCIKVTKPGIKSPQDFPQIICIEYETLPKGKSVLWRKDNDGSPCVFTPAASINNRSLLPCQDPPSAMATWQSWITVPEDFYVSITGDESCKMYVYASRDDMSEMPDADITSTFKGNALANSVLCEDKDILERMRLVCYYYYTSMVLPIATIAIAIGKWEIRRSTSMPKLNPSYWEDERTSQSLDFCKHYEYPCHLNSRGGWNADTQLSVVYPPSLREKVRPLSDFLPFVIKAAVHLLGKYPCRRVEVVFLPQCFASLGLASPNLIFLSPTLAINDPAAFIRIAHEISHAWFGINIGAQDWTEEWISEGFATYTEDLIYMEALMAYQNSQASTALSASGLCPYFGEIHTDSETVTRHLEELSDLRAHLRYRTLSSELENSEEDLQTLRPMQGESLVADGITFVKNGLNPEKTFLQVHYLKGYFLLRFLRTVVGKDEFNTAVKAYVAHYHGQLVFSQDILKFFIKRCPVISDKGITLSYLVDSWLHQSGLNTEMKEMYSAVSNSLVRMVKDHHQFWVASNKNFGKSLSKRLRCELTKFLFPDQLVLLLEHLLELPKIHSRTLRNIFSHYKIAGQNADVRHRWCELVVKHNYQDLTVVERFLTCDQSMGVYLYGELIISRKPNHRQLARKIFTDNERDMDENSRVTVHAMLYGN